jgi:tetratricopeptide (TPR) repeat protein
MSSQHYQRLSHRIYNNFPLIGWILRRWTAKRLANDNSGEAVAILAEAVTRSKDQVVKEIAFSVLKQLKSQESVDAFCRVWEETRHKDLTSILKNRRYISTEPRLLVLSALKVGALNIVKNGDADILDFLLEALNDKDTQIASAASVCILELKNRSTSESLSRQLKTHNNFASTENSTETQETCRKDNELELIEANPEPEVEVLVENCGDKAKAEYLYNQGNVKARIGMFDAALSLYRQALALDGTNPMYYNNIAASLKRLGRFQEAIKIYELLIQEFPEYGKGFLSVGSTSIEIEDYDSAISAYRRFLSAYKKGQFTFNPIVGGLDQTIDGDNVLENSLLTSINYLSPQHQKIAIEAFNEAIANENKPPITSGEAIIYFNQAEFDFKNGDLILAESKLSKAIELDPKYSVAYYSRGYIRNDLNNHVGALDDYTQAISINPSYADAYLSRGNTLLVLKRFQEAVQDAKQARNLAVTQKNTDLASRASSMLNFIGGVYDYH